MMTNDQHGPREDDRDDLLDELAYQHQQVTVLFSEIAGTPLGDPLRKELIEQVAELLSGHLLAEERHLHPLAAARLPNGEAVAARGRADHAAIEGLLGELLRLSATSAGFDRVVARLVEHTTGHMWSEEAQLFRPLRGAVAPRELDRLGEELRRTEALAPDTPRRRPPTVLPPDDLPPPEQGLRDRIRDFLTP
ncbi:hemerythrin domain-containing protein [Kitasatospora camelliae]|uniref:Hemerythrin domain-containing protein n=1 Tax=Kitasatospora camelliae TaxID=3156397 RepID=A0AAU8JQR6_9ACTN